MSRKRIQKDSPDRVVYSTNPEFRTEEAGDQQAETLPPAKQKLRLRLDTKQRAGKAVTLVEGFVGANADLEDLGKRMKNFCGTGGSVKEGYIVIQGDHRDKLRHWLAKNGYPSAG